MSKFTYQKPYEMPKFTKQSVANIAISFNEYIFTVMDEVKAVKQNKSEILSKWLHSLIVDNFAS